MLHGLSQPGTPGLLFFNPSVDSLLLLQGHFSTLGFLYRGDWLLRVFLFLKKYLSKFTGTCSSSAPVPGSLLCTGWYLYTDLTQIPTWKLMIE